MVCQQCNRADVARIDQLLDLKKTRQSAAIVSHKQRLISLCKRVDHAEAFGSWRAIGFSM